MNISCDQILELPDGIWTLASTLLRPQRWKSTPRGARGSGSASFKQRRRQRRLVGQMCEASQEVRHLMQHRRRGPRSPLTGPFRSNTESACERRGECCLVLVPQLTTSRRASRRDKAKDCTLAGTLVGARTGCRQKEFQRRGAGPRVCLSARHSSTSMTWCPWNFEHVDRFGTHLEMREHLRITVDFMCSHSGNLQPTEGLRTAKTPVNIHWSVLLPPVDGALRHEGRFPIWSSVGLVLDRLPCLSTRHSSTSMTWCPWNFEHVDRFARQTGE